MSESLNAELQHWQARTDDLQVSLDHMRESRDELKVKFDNLTELFQEMMKDLAMHKAMVDRMRIAMSQGAEL